MTSANRGILFQQIDRLYREGTLSGLGDSQLLERYVNRRDEAAFRGAGRSAWADGSEPLPQVIARPEGHRRRLSGNVFGAGP